MRIFLLLIADFLVVLSKVKHFLPELEQADQQLKVLLADSQSRQALDMEEIEEGKPCIEMVRL